MAEELAEISDRSVFTHPAEILVELRGRTADGEFATSTYQFEAVHGGDEQVTARGSIDSAHEPTVHDILADAGYTLVDDH